MQEILQIIGKLKKIIKDIYNAAFIFLIKGTIEKSNEAEEEVYETINISKIKAQTPNLRVSLFRLTISYVNNDLLGY